MLAKTYGSSIQGVSAQLIVIEVNVTQGQRFYMSGLPDSAIKESQHRIESAFKHLNYQMPRTKVVVNLAPAGIRKEGSSYDLPIALSILKASQQIEAKTLDEYLIMGEISLGGILRPIKGVLPIAMRTKEKSFKGFILPKSNAKEAALVEGLQVIGVSSLQEAIDYLDGKTNILPTTNDENKLFLSHDSHVHDEFDFCDVQGQQNIKRALEIAAAGGHNAIMIGAPGAGKTMLAKRLPSIMPPLTLEEALETTAIHSVAGKIIGNKGLITKRPFRSPHHTISDIALVGGGSNPQPGEISLAHHGILFLDELPEFKKTALEVMRQPMEDRKVAIARAKFSLEYPANFMLIASMNPCPCGYYNHPNKTCTCPPGGVKHYLNKISGPLLDRIDLQIEVAPVNFDEMTKDKKHEQSKDILQRVIRARNIQLKRFKNIENVYCNAMMGTPLMKEVCTLHNESLLLLKNAMEKLQLSARAYDRILKTARTIADLATSENITSEHIAEAIQYRSLDRENWAT